MWPHVVSHSQLPPFQPFGGQPFPGQSIGMVKLRELITESGGVPPLINPEGYFAKFHKVLQIAAMRQVIRPRSNSRWVWAPNDPDLGRVRQIVRQEVARISGTAANPGPPPRQLAAAPPAPLTCSQLPDQAFSMNLSWQRDQNYASIRQPASLPGANQWQPPVESRPPPHPPRMSQDCTKANLDEFRTQQTRAETLPPICPTQDSLQQDKTVLQQARIPHDEKTALQHLSTQQGAFLPSDETATQRSRTPQATLQDETAASSALSNDVDAKTTSSFATEQTTQSAQDSATERRTMPKLGAKIRPDEQSIQLHTDKVKDRTRKPRMRRTSQAELRALKRKWMEAELADGEVKIRQDWEALPHDNVTRELLDRRYRDLGKGRSQECYDRVRSMLDSLIRQRSAELRTPLGENLHEADRPMSLLRKLGLEDAQLPHPALVFLESDSDAVDRMAECADGHSANGYAEEVLLESLESYMNLDATERPLLWSIVAHRARLQDFNILQALAANKCLRGSVAPESIVAPQPPSSFEAFLLASGIPIQPSPEKQQKTSPDASVVDPITILESEGAFLSLGLKDHLHWFQQADHLHHIGPDSLFPASANWMPASE